MAQVIEIGERTGPFLNLLHKEFGSLRQLANGHQVLRQPHLADDARGFDSESGFKGYAPAPVVNRWGGFYLGAHVGAGEANWGGGFDLQTADSAVLADQLDTDGVLGGVHGSYNWQFGRGVFGIEGDWSWMDWSDNARALDADSHQITSEVDSLASVRARIGYVVGHDQSVLLFANVGAAWADADALACATTGCDSATDLQHVDFDDAGVVVGGGFEYAMTDQFRLRVDGSYYFFDDNTKLDFDSAHQGDHLELEDIYTFRVGGTFYFTRTPRPVAALK